MNDQLLARCVKAETEREKFRQLWRKAVTEATQLTREREQIRRTIVLCLYWVGILFQMPPDLLPTYTLAENGLDSLKAQLENILEKINNDVNGSRK